MYCILFISYLEQDVCQHECTESASKNCLKETIINAAISIDINMTSNINIQYPNRGFFKRAMIMYFMILRLSDKFRLSFYGITGTVSCSNNSTVEEYCCDFRGTLKVTLNQYVTFEELDVIESAHNMINFKYVEIDRDSLAEHSAWTQQDGCNTSIYNTVFSININYRSFDYFLYEFDRSTLNGSFEGVPSSLEIHVQTAFFSNFNNNMLTKLLNYSVSYTFLNDSSPKIKKTLSSFIQSVITYVTMATSTIVLIGTLFIFIYFNLFKTLAENVCINIMLMLTFGNILFMFGVGAVDNQYVCLVIGVVLHYTWLCVFTWVSIYTFLISKILMQLKVNLAYDINKDFSKTSVYFMGYGFPMLFVVPCIFIEFLKPNGFDVGYSVMYCFPTRYPANLIFFSAPVVLSLAVNFILLCVSGRHLNLHVSDNLHQSSKRTMGYIIAFVKMCLISGLFWILGILAQVLKNEILGYVFIIVTGSQGLIVSVCFLKSQVVAKKIRQYLQRRSTENRSSQISIQQFSGASIECLASTKPVVSEENMF